MTDAHLVEQIARQYLAPETADRWLALCRPAVRLRAAGPTTGEAPVIASFGGLPRLPDDVDWPVWSGHGPLSYLGEIDLAALPAAGLNPGVRIPQTGRLLAFYFDGAADDGAAAVGYFEPGSTRRGAHLLHLASNAGTPRTPPTPRMGGYAPRPLTGHQILSTPDIEQPLLKETFAPDQEQRDFYLNHPVNDDAFQEALREREAVPAHQIGGWATPVQGPVEFEASWAADGIQPGDPRTDELARAWRLVLQIDSDNDFMWGDGGTLYWLQRGSADGTLDVEFTWQCY